MGFCFGCFLLFWVLRGLRCCLVVLGAVFIGLKRFVLTCLCLGFGLLLCGCVRAVLV